VIHVLDTLTVRPGVLVDVKQRVHEVYEPLVASMGMRLVHVWMAPAVELRDRPTELVVLWELDDVPAFWRMRVAAARDPRAAGFWASLEPMLADRTRRLMCDPDDAGILR
jgi:hypothetical protein